MAICLGIHHVCITLVGMGCLLEITEKKHSEQCSLPGTIWKTKSEQPGSLPRVSISAFPFMDLTPIWMGWSLF